MILSAILFIAGVIIIGFGVLLIWWMLTKQMDHMDELDMNKHRGDRRTEMLLLVFMYGYGMLLLGLGAGAIYASFVAYEAIT